MPKKVLILTPFTSQIGGAETFAEELYREANKRFDTYMCTIQWFRIWRGINWLHAFDAVRQLMIEAITYCLTIHPDTVHALGFNAAFVGAILKPIFKFKLVVTPLALYDFNNRFLAAMVRWTLKSADAILAESELSYDNLSQVASSLKIKVFTHWVDTDRFFPINRKNEMLKVLFAGRKLPEKGIHIIKQVEQELKGVDFLYAENVPNTDIPQFFQMADVLVVPSLYVESPNRVVSEGAASGCVVIVSNRGALPEQVRDFGFAVEPTADEFKKAIDVLDKDRMWLQLLRDDVIKYARENLTEKNAEIILGEY
jgi:glycosyltransferase involved in cell wall biosynthesis